MAIPLYACNQIIHEMVDFNYFNCDSLLSQVRDLWSNSIYTKKKFIGSCSDGKKQLPYLLKKSENSSTTTY